ncbi:MAG: hypothetical protein KF817_13490 [Phycisphaeraceae bacterium]|nr:hypothetical protein [Phycisphaeraceae bacterium]
MIHLGRSAFFASSLIMPLSLASAGTVTLEVAPARSSFTGELEVSLRFPGFLIGDYDPETNPGGTLTRPGLSGGSGNMPVNTTVRPEVTTVINGAAPEGAMGIEVDARGLTFAIHDLDLDLLGGVPGDGDVILNLTYQTFRSFNPDSVFFGGIELPIPFGTASVTALTAVQAGPAIGLLVSMEGPDTVYAATITIPVALFGSALVLGESLPFGPVPAVLPLSGSLTIGGCAQVELVLGGEDASEVVDDGPFKGVGFSALPLPLPTILPPGGTANVLLSGDLDQVISSQAIELLLVARTADVIPDPDLNGDGDVGFADLLLLLADWGACAPSGPCPPDLDQDCSVGFADLLMLLAAWSS